MGLNLNLKFSLIQSQMTITILMYMNEGRGKNIYSIKYVIPMFEHQHFQIHLSNVVIKVNVKTIPTLKLTLKGTKWNKSLTCEHAGNVIYKNIGQTPNSVIVHAE